MLQGHDPPGSLVGVTLGNYRVTDRIGAGGMGVVYRAQDLRLGRSVAVKALPEAMDSDPAARRKLMDEARHGSSVVSPYVATVFDVVEQDGGAYIVMEYIDGRRLDDVLREDRPDLKRVAGYAVEIAEALTAIHAAGLVHRDLKPGNVMVTPAGHVKVMDFGLARENAAALLREVGSLSTQSTQTAPGNVAGTVLYMSPEQLRDEPLDARSDLFSFGTLLHEAVTGVHPFERATILASASAILHEQPTGSGVAPGIVPTPMAPIVGLLLEKDRDRRYASAELLLNDLRTVQAGQIVAAQSAPVAKPFPYRAAIAALVVTAAVVLAGYRFWPSKPGSTGRPVVAVLPFEDKTGEPRGDLYAQLLANLIASNLTESSLVRALPDERVQEILRGLDLHAPQSAGLAAVAKAADPRWIVSGTLYKEGDASYAMVKVFRPGKSEPSDSFRVNGGSASALAELASAKLQAQLFPDRKEAVAAASRRAVGGSTSEEAQLPGTGREARAARVALSRCNREARESRQARSGIPRRPGAVCRRPRPGRVLEERQGNGGSSRAHRGAPQRSRERWMRSCSRRAPSSRGSAARPTTSSRRGASSSPSTRTIRPRGSRWPMRSPCKASRLKRFPRSTWRSSSIRRTRTRT